MYIESIWNLLYAKWFYTKLNFFSFQIQNIYMTINLNDLFQITENVVNSSEMMSICRCAMQCSGTPSNLWNRNVLESSTSFWLKVNNIWNDIEIQRCFWSHRLTVNCIKYMHIDIFTDKSILVYISYLPFFPLSLN